MTNLPMDPVLAEVEAIAVRLADDSAEAKLSVNEWIERVRGELQAAQQLARAGSPVEEDQCWLNAAAICLRRAVTVRRLAG